MRSEIGAKRKRHHDNAPSHTSFVFIGYSAKNGIVTNLHPVYSLDGTPTDFFPFPKVKIALKRSHYETPNAVKTACTHALRDISVAGFQGPYEAYNLACRGTLILKEHTFKTTRVFQGYL